MKPKKFYKKLVLNKKTVAHLDNNEMNAAFGGIPRSMELCPTYGINSCHTVCYTVGYGDPQSDPCCIAC